MDVDAPPLTVAAGREACRAAPAPNVRLAVASTEGRPAVAPNDGARVGAARGANNFDALRLLCALLVVYGHEGPDATGTAGLRLLVFLAISGYLVTGSWRSDPHPGRFLLRRLLRLWPAHAVAIVICAALSFVWPAPDMPELSRLASLFYLSNLWFSGFDWGFFPFAMARMNQSLWMLTTEVDLYLALALVAVAHGRLLAPVAAVVALAAAAFSTLEGPGSLGGLLQSWSLFLSGFFCMGVLLREWPALRRPAAVALQVLAGVVLWAGLGQRTAGLLLILPSAAVWIGEQSWPVCRSAARFGDLSLGVFLWGWPVHQVTALWIDPATPMLLRFAVVAAQALALAALSWHLIEARALRLKPARPAAGHPNARAQAAAAAADPGTLSVARQAQG